MFGRIDLRRILLRSLLSVVVSIVFVASQLAPSAVQDVVQAAGEVRL